MENTLKKCLAVFLILFLFGLPFLFYLILRKTGCSGWFGYTGSVLTYFGTSILGFVTVWQQKKYRNLSYRKDQKMQDYIKEEQRLSSMPYLVTTCKQINITNIKKTTNLISFQDGVNPISCVEELNEFKKLECDKKYLFVLYSIENVGRDTATDICLKVGSCEYRITAIMKGQNFDLYFQIEPLKLENLTQKIVFDYWSLDNVHYSQNDEFVILDVKIDKSYDNDWKIKKNRISAQEIVKENTKQ